MQSSKSINSDTTILHQNDFFFQISCMKPTKWKFQVNVDYSLKVKHQTVSTKDFPQLFSLFILKIFFVSKTLGWQIKVRFSPKRYWATRRDTKRQLRNIKVKLAQEENFENTWLANSGRSVFAADVRDTAAGGAWRHAVVVHAQVFPGALALAGGCGCGRAAAAVVHVQQFRRRVWPKLSSSFVVCIFGLWLACCARRAPEDPAVLAADPNICFLVKVDM